MKKLLSVFWGMMLLLFVHNTAQSQQTLITVNNGGQYEADWNAYVHVPSDYNDPANANTYYPTIIFFPGIGEVGTNASLVIANGPGAYIAQTTNPWNGNVVVNGATVKFIVISLQPAQIYPAVAQINGKIQKLKQLYRIDNNRLYLTGLSHGGWCSTTFVRGDNTSGPSTPYASQVAAIVNVEGVTPDTPATKWDNYAALGGRLACFEQRLDYRAMQTDVNRMNSVRANSAIYTQTTFGDEKHCCWEQFYGGYGAAPVNFMLDGISQNIYQWIARQSLQVMPSITSPLTAAGNVGTPFTYTITATGNTTTYTATNLPTGLTVNTSTGVISGTPTAQGTFSVSISAANSSASIYKTLTLTISPAPPPTITSSLTASGNVGTAFTYAITATGSVTSYYASNLPAGLTVNTTTGVISGTPTTAGTTSITISATNSSGTTFKTVTLTINPPAGEKIYANIKYTSPSATNPWYNNITGVTTNNLLNSNNQATAVDLEFLTTAWNTWYDGPQTGNNSGVYPDAVLKDYYYFGIFDAPQTVSFRYKDLTPGQKYNLILYAGSVFNMAGVTDNGTTVYTIGGVSKSLYVQNNTANTVTFTDVVADGSGYITVAMSKASGTPVGYLNAVVLEKVLSSANQLPVANAGADQAIQLPGSVTLTGSGTDTDGTIASYAWTKLSGPAGGNITSPSSASTTVTGLAAGTYQFQLTVTDNLGATHTDIVNVTLYGERIFMSIKYTDSPAAGSPWNNITGVATSNLLNSNNQATAVDLEFLTTTGWHTYFNGPQTGANSGVYPDAVLRDYYYFGFYDSPEETVSFRYKDLTPGQKYNVTLYAGSVFNMAGVTDNGTTIYTIGGVSKSLYVQNNTANTVTFTDVVADGSGYITVAMSKASGTPVGYINAAVLEKTNIAPTSNAGATQVITLPTSTTTLTGSGTDIDGTIATYAWTQVSGPSIATIASGSSASTGVSALVQGTYIFKLTVTDNQGATGSDTMSILVNAAAVAQRILIDAGLDVSQTGPQDASGKYWNNMKDARAGVQVLNAVTTTNAATTVDLEVVNRIDGTFNTGGIGLNNLVTGVAVGDYPATATGDYAFADPSTTSGRWKLTGLDNTKQYTVKFWGRKTDVNGGSRIIQIKRASESTWQEYDAMNNDNFDRKAAFTFTGETEMNFDIRVKDGNQFGYISVVDISFVTPGGRPVSDPATHVTKAGEEAVTNTATVYPNPVKNTFTLDVNSKALGKTQVTIFNAAMQVAKKLSLNKNTTAFKSSISIAELPKGTYFVQVRTGNNNSMIKIIKQ